MFKYKQLNNNKKDNNIKLISLYYFKFNIY